MKSLFSLTVPFLGRIYAQRDTSTPPRLAAELLQSPCGREMLLYCGRLRLYLTPAAALAAERR